MKLLDLVAIRLPCGACGGEYEVPLRDVAASQRMLHEGCPVTEATECPPLAQAGLAPAELLERLQSDWEQLEESARRMAGRLVIHPTDTVVPCSANDRPTASRRRA